MKPSAQVPGPLTIRWPGLLDLIAAVIKLADGDEVCWATDLTYGGAALLIA